MCVSFCLGSGAQAQVRQDKLKAMTTALRMYFTVLEHCKQDAVSELDGTGFWLFVT
jgi:hypothetical protein